MCRPSKAGPPKIRNLRTVAEWNLNPKIPSGSCLYIPLLVPNTYGFVCSVQDIHWAMDLVSQGN